jgi:DNA-binding GntR family transcriptional regulator
MTQGSGTVSRRRIRPRVPARIPQRKPDEGHIADRAAGLQGRLSDKVYQFVVQEVMSGRLPPSTRITEQSLAAMVGVSPAPVREAMEKLEQNGWIEKIPYTGAFIKRMDSARIKDICQLREILELGTLKMVEQGLTQDQLDGLRSAVEQIDAAHRTGDRAAITRADAEFHRRIVALAGNARMDEIFESVVLQASSLMFMPIDGLPYFTQEYRDKLRRTSHEKIYQALADRKFDLVERLLREHIKNGYETALKMRELFQI